MGKLWPRKLIKPGEQLTLYHETFPKFMTEFEKIEADRLMRLLMEVMAAQNHLPGGSAAFQFNSSISKLVSKCQYEP